MILIKSVTIIDLETGGLESNRDLLIKEGRIVEIADNISVEGAHIIQGDGQYLMPSLFDSHAHLNSSEMGYLFIANGITGIRHLSGGEKAMAFAASIKKGERIGPDVYASGQIYDGVDALDKSPTYRYIDSEASAAQAVLDTIKEGYLWVKTYPSIRPEHLKALMAKASSLGIKVCGHMSYHVDALTLRDWGYHCCEHSSSLPQDLDQVKALALSGMWLCPTQVVCETLPDYVWDNKQLEDLAHYEYVPEVIRTFWKEKNVKIIEGYKRRGLKPDINVVIERGKTFMKYSDRVLAGSDTMYPGIIAGFSLHDELEKLVTLYEQPTLKVLRMATVNAAEYMALSKQKGLVKVGYDADLLLLKKNPLEDIRATRSIAGVLKMGVYYDEARLKDFLNRSKQEPTDFFELLF